ncbi:MAG: valine--tRNA ligase [Elusimicrobia bacterium]|nr:valine--tRNA ligase [Elusimicrobiota bacterium]
MESRFNYLTAEPLWLEAWSQSGLGRPNRQAGKALFTMVIPPPNITGSLHMGHALDNILPDCLLRLYLMRGSDVLRVPGTDHAGIATQYVVEKNLKIQGIDRNALKREEFENIIKEWAEKTKTGILGQLVKMGCAMDFSRARFTMDETCSRAVRFAFKSLFDARLIYQADRLISWCPRCRSALSDLELEWQTSRGQLHYLKYPMIGGGFITVATTRPETMLGDAAVAVNPKDPRYEKFVGKKILLPLMKREIPVIADRRVESDFGTGAVKVTPAHDPLDWAIGHDHGLPLYSVIGEDGNLTDAAGPYRRLSIKEARKKVLDDLKTQELLEREEPYTHNTAVCYRCATSVEPLVSKQWFLQMAPLRDLAVAAFEKNGQPKFYPEHWGEIYLNWLKNLKDWCLSRQIIWGHRIPVWYCEKCPPICATETPVKCPSCGNAGLKQDPDVLDTWFSSSLWPMSVFGWPQETEDFKRFYPTSLMVTGYDITYLWVARMIMMGLHFTKQVPFAEVYLHGLVRDEKGRKMSKTLGNVIDPQEIQKEYGTDALRYGVLIKSQPGKDTPLNKDIFVGAKNFVTKLWNAGRFLKLEHSKESAKPGPRSQQELLAILDQHAHPSDWWAIGQFNETLAAAQSHLERLDAGGALRKIYDSFWGSFCDWHIEIVKLRRGGCGPAVGLAIYRDFIKILQPFIPFVTHEIAKELGNENSGQEAVLARETWPAPWPRAPKAAEASRLWWRAFSSIVTEMRIIRNDFQINPGQEMIFSAANGEISPEDMSLVEKLTKSKRVNQADGRARVRRTIGSGTWELTVFFDKEWNPAKETARLAGQVGELEKAIARLRDLLEKSDFSSKAPSDVVEKERARLEGLRGRKAKLSDYLTQLGG